MKSLGMIADVSGSAYTAPSKSISDTERITQLERRVATLEILLNDVMHHLDNPSKSKPKANSKKAGKKIAHPSQPKSLRSEETLPKGFPNKEKSAALLKLISANPDRTRGELAALSGNSKNLTRKILHSLSELGLIKVSQRVVENDKQVTIYQSRSQ